MAGGIECATVRAHLTGSRHSSATTKPHSQVPHCEILPRLAARVRVRELVDNQRHLRGTCTHLAPNDGKVPTPPRGLPSDSLAEIWACIQPRVAGLSATSRVPGVDCQTAHAGSGISVYGYMCLAHIQWCADLRLAYTMKARLWTRKRVMSLLYSTDTGRQ